MRFPLDKGVLLVRCPYCGYSFRADPDEPTLYRGGRFDLTEPRLETTPTFTFFQNFDIKKVVLIVLFSLLFLNLYKAFSGLGIDIEKEENIPLEELEPEQRPPVKDAEGLYQI